MGGWCKNDKTLDSRWWSWSLSIMSENACGHSEDEDESVGNSLERNATLEEGKIGGVWRKARATLSENKVANWARLSFSRVRGEHHLRHRREPMKEKIFACDCVSFAAPFAPVFCVRVLAVSPSAARLHSLLSPRSGRPGRRSRARSEPERTAILAR